MSNRISIEQMKNLCSKATTGPWYVMKDGFLKNKKGPPTVYATNEDLNYICQCSDFANVGPTLNQENAAFIAASRQFIPKAIATIEAADELANAARDVLDNLREGDFISTTRLSKLEDALKNMEKEQ